MKRWGLPLLVAFMMVSSIVSSVALADALENDSAKIVPNPANTDSLSSGGRYRFVDGGDSTVVPYNKKSIYHAIAADVNGKNTFYFLLATGRSGNVISKKAADKLKLEPFGGKQVRGSAGNDSTRYVTIDSLQIGTMVWYPQQFEVVDDAERSECVFDGFDGILGYDFMALIPIRINHAWKQVVLFDRSKASPAKPGVAVDIDLTRRQTMAKAIFADYPIQVVIDFASSAPLVLFYDWIWVKTLFKGIPFNLNKYECEGIEGFWIAYEAYLKDSLKIGDFSADSIGFFIAHRLVEAQKLSPGSAVVGTTYFDNCDVFVDYPNSRIYLEKRKEKK